MYNFEHDFCVFVSKFLVHCYAWSSFLLTAQALQAATAVHVLRRTISSLTAITSKYRTITYKQLSLHCSGWYILTPSLLRCCCKPMNVFVQLRLRYTLALPFASSTHLLLAVDFTYCTQWTWNVMSRYTQIKATRNGKATWQGAQPTTETYKVSVCNWSPVASFVLTARCSVAASTLIAYVRISANAFKEKYIIWEIS